MPGELPSSQSFGGANGGGKVFKIMGAYFGSSLHTSSCGYTGAFCSFGSLLYSRGYQHIKLCCELLRGEYMVAVTAVGTILLVIYQSDDIVLSSSTTIQP